MLLKLRDIQKRFGPTHALRGVSLELERGETRALIGENGAGKSTLMKVLSGAYQPDGGTIELDGQPFRPAGPAEALRGGVAMIYQELNLAPHLSAEENIALGVEPTRLGWINRRRRREIAHAALEELGATHIPLQVPVARLSIAGQQMVEIARAIASRPKVLIMDEPTSSLTQADTARLFEVIDRLAGRGVGIIYISHFLEESRRVCRTFTVLRDGSTVADGTLADTDRATIIRHMVGRDLKEIYPRVPHTRGQPVLELRGLVPPGKSGPVSLTLHEGEIFGLAGLVGAGRTETLRACFGLDAVEGGEVGIIDRDGGSLKADTRTSPHERLTQRCGMLSENRKEEGLLLGRSIADNMTLTRLGLLGKLGWVSRRRQLDVADDWIKKVGCRAAGPAQPIVQLSGGNQQKVAFGRLLYHGARVFLLDEPARGIDIGSKAQLFEMMGQLAAQGAGILFASSYLPELLGVCDTVGVMCRGALVEVRPVERWTEDEIISAAVGAEGAAPMSAAVDG